MMTKTTRTGGAQAPPQRGADAFFREKKEKVPMKVSAIRKMEFPLNDESAQLGEPIVIIITAGDYSREIVIHHPVGANKLQPEDWVLTPISEIEPLLAMKDDPSAGKKAAAANKIRIDHLVSLGKYILKDKTVHYPENTFMGASLDEVRRTTQSSFDTAKAEAREDYLRECAEKNRQPKKDWKFGKALMTFQPTVIKVYEDGLKELLRTDAAYQDKLKKLDPVPFETLAGPQQDRPQLRMNVRQQANRHQMVDVVHKHLVNSMSGGYSIPMAPPKTLADALTSANGDPDKASRTFLEALLGGALPGREVPAPAPPKSAPSPKGGGA
jgi:hypothetical protein